MGVHVCELVFRIEKLKWKDRESEICKKGIGTLCVYCV